MLLMFNVSCLSEISTTRDVSVAICLTIYNGEHQYNSNMIHAKKKRKKKLKVARMFLVQQELSISPEHLNSSPVLEGVVVFNLQF